MGKLYWLKTRVDLFLDPRVLDLLNQPNGDSYFVLWSYLKGMAGMVNDNGKIYVAGKKPMTVSLIAKCLHRRKNFIEKGIDVLVELELLDRNEEGVLRITNWDELQDFQRDEHRRELNAKRQQRYRERQRQAKETNMAVAEEPPQSANADSSPKGALTPQSAAGSQFTYQESKKTACDSRPVGACMEKQGEEKDCSTAMTEPNARPSDEEFVPEFAPETITEEPEMVKNFSSYQSVKKYRDLFHGINGVIAEKLAELERMWGTQATCKAVEIAKEQGVSHINYIKQTLINNNGQLTTRSERAKRKEQEENYGYDSFDEYVKSVLSGEFDDQSRLSQNAG